MKTKLDFKYVHLNFQWSWVKDKEILWVGDDIMGMVYLLDSDGRVVGAYGYELIK